MSTSRFLLTDSLYGPGTVVAWLLTLCAVLVSWTLNPTSRCKDTFTLDLIVALLLPLVAAVHLIYQVFRLPAPISEVFTTQDLTLQQYASAIEAPLLICEMSAMAALVLALCCGPWWTSHVKLKRLCLVLVVGMISWGVESIMFVMATMKGVKIDEATLTRPYLFFLTPLVACVWAYSGFLVIVIGVYWFVGFIHDRKSRNSKTDLESFKRARQAALVSVPDNTPDHINSIRLRRMDLQQLRLQHRTTKNHMHSIARISYLYAFLVYLGLMCQSKGWIRW
jgi:hypothetical protein